MVTQHPMSLGQECLIMGMTVMCCLVALKVYMWSTTTETMLEHIAVKLTMELVPLIRQSMWLLTVSTVDLPVLVVGCYSF